MEWQPIETAPKDGGNILVRGQLWPEVGPDLPVAAVEAFWNGNRWKPIPQTYYSLDVDAEYWAPLPEPPK